LCIVDPAETINEFVGNVKSSYQLENPQLTVALQIGRDCPIWLKAVG